MNSTRNGTAVAVEGLTYRFGTTAAVDALDVSIAPGRITGLLGRNGAGKSTLMSLLAGQRRPTSGRVLLDGVEPFEDARAMADTVLVREQTPQADSMTVTEYFEVAATFRPRWDRSYAERLLDRFGVPVDKKLCELSSGNRAAAIVSAGLATRAPLTMFDEPHLGMDAPSRYAFYEELVADYAEHPRTIVLSTHIIDEAAKLLEDVVIIDRGRLLVHDDAATLRSRGAELTGPAAAVDDLTADLRVLSTRSLGATKAVVVYDELDPGLTWRAETVGVHVGPLPLQDLFVHLTRSESTEEAPS